MPNINPTSEEVGGTVESHSRPVTAPKTSAEAGVAGQVERFDTPALASGVLLVHVEQVAGPQAGLVAPGAGSDFEDDRANAAVLGVDQGGLDAGDGLAGLGFQAGQLLAGQFGQFRVGARLDGGPEFGGFR